ncbi:glycosyltransferase [Paenibacillus sp. FSL K6-3166]|uniref:glycosyltransferase n=1 Tax=unclassified Paenibacillus TaxID=185978 RepID=UPI000B9FB4FF|nr:glycosyltransferase [Paenibacillus sp. VTT E-133291]OZQ83601.1 sugar transferase [Paenibacillus sp. VTT E-133291]
MLAPVLIFVYARPEHTKKTIEALANNYLANETDVFIFSDAPKNENSSMNVQLVRDYINTLSKRNLFKSVKIINSQVNKGLANSIILGVDEIIKLKERVIVLEDDLVSSPDFLTYMNDALSFYKEDKSIWSISGYTFDLKIPNYYKSEVYLSYRGCSWGWATWKNRWDSVDWMVSDYSLFKKDKRLREKLNHGGRDMAAMLDAQMDGKIDSWAIRWCYSQSKSGMFTVYPRVSRIRNTGLDGSGTHSGVSNRYDVYLNNNYEKCDFDNPGLNETIIKSFKDKFGTRFEYFIIWNKTLLKKMLRI